MRRTCSAVCCRRGSTRDWCFEPDSPAGRSRPPRRCSYDEGLVADAGPSARRSPPRSSRRGARGGCTWRGCPARPGSTQRSPWGERAALVSVRPRHAVHVRGAAGRPPRGGKTGFRGWRPCAVTSCCAPTSMGLHEDDGHGVVFDLVEPGALGSGSAGPPPRHPARAARGAVLDRVAPGSALEEDGERALVDRATPHLGAEDAALDVGAEGGQGARRRRRRAVRRRGRGRPPPRSGGGPCGRRRTA